MTELHAGLRLYRDQLRGAIAQQLYDERIALRRGRRALKIGLPAVAAAAAGAVAVALTGASSVQSADAAILHRVALALTAPPAMILHERALVSTKSTTAPYELWVENTRPYQYHVLKWGHERAGTSGAPYDPAAELRALVASGKATVDGPTVVNGVSAYRLKVGGSSDRFLNGTAYVSQADYHPLEIDTTGNGGERIVFQTYEYLPATSANLRLMAIAGPATTPAAGK